MNIVFCLNHFMPHQVAGTEVYTCALAKSLQDKGHSVAIVIPNYNSEINCEYVYDDLSVRKYAETNLVNRSVVSGKKPPDGINAFKELVCQIKPDIVHVQELAGSSGIGIYHLRALKEMGIKIIFTMHLARYSCFCGTLMYRGKEKCDGMIDIKRCTRCALSKLPANNFVQKVLYTASVPLYNLHINTGKINHSGGTAFSYPFIIDTLHERLFEINNLCEKIIVITDWYKKVLLKNGISEKKLRLVKQALPHEVDASLKKEWVTPYPVKLIFIGRIDPLKGLHLLLQAMNNLPEDKVSLDIYGAVNDEGYFNYWKGITSTNKNIRWCGSLPQHEVVATIAQNDALVLPSTFSEMSPLVIQEAFAAGVPVIGADVAGIAEQIQDRKNGLLFNFLEVASLKNILLFLIKDPAFLNVLKRNIVAPESFETVVEQMLEIYKEVLADDFTKLKTEKKNL